MMRRKLIAFFVSISVAASYSVAASAALCQTSITPDCCCSSATMHLDCGMDCMESGQQSEAVLTSAFTPAPNKDFSVLPLMTVASVSPPPNPHTLALTGGIDVAWHAPPEKLYLLNSILRC
jgi:hypothetical protein